MSRVFSATRSLMAAAVRAKTTATAGKATVKAASSRRGTAGSSALTKELPLSPAMRKFLGVPEISRPGAVKKIWEYIKEHELQNPLNKREINCDEKLKAIFAGKDKVTMLEIAKLLSPHFIKPN